MKRKADKALDFFVNLLGVVFLPIAVTVLATLLIFRHLVGLWLKLTLGEAFGGLLSGGDKVFVPNVPASRKITLILWHIRSDQKIDVMQKMTQTINEKVSRKNPQIKLVLSCKHSFR